MTEVQATESGWPATPPERLVRAERYDRETGLWTVAAYQGLRTGDIYRAIGPDGDYWNAWEERPLAPGEISINVCLADPYPNAPRGEGYAVVILPFDSLEAALARSAN